VAEKSQPEAVHKDSLPLLPDDVPVVMPDLPLRLTVTTEQQFKALSDMVRSRILGVIQYQPLTAKQIALRLHATPGAIGHHLHVLEEAGLVKVVARRLTRGIVTSYYTRTARVFDYGPPLEVRGFFSLNLDLISKAQAELTESLISYEDRNQHCDAFPHVRLSLAKAKEYQRRFMALIDELVEEEPDPCGEVYGVFVSIFKSPPYMQVLGPGACSTASEAEDV
jgi:DNA-binding transcriptional ArsR family regulator